MSADAFRYFHKPEAVDPPGQEIQRAAILESYPSSKVVGADARLRTAESQAKRQRATVRMRDTSYYVRYVPREI